MVLYLILEVNDSFRTFLFKICVVLVFFERLVEGIKVELVKPQSSIVAGQKDMVVVLIYTDVLDVRR